MLSNYHQFLAAKRFTAPTSGFDVPSSTLNSLLLPLQLAGAQWALRRGRAAVFLDTGLGKTFLQLEIADKICQRTGGKFLLLAPLAVSRQSLLECRKFNIQTPVRVCVSQDGVDPGPSITITNYEKLHKFDSSQFIGVGLDEASILKSLNGATRNLLIDTFKQTPYRYVFTATPSPNDLTEIGSYSEFLGIMTRSEMQSMFFRHDGGDTSKWRLMGHAEKDFFRWMATWSLMARKPSDLGFDDAGYELPELKIHEHIVKDKSIPAGRLFQVEARTLQDQRESRRNTIELRVGIVADLANNSSEPWAIWCNLNDESTAATAAIRGAAEVTGSMPEYKKELTLINFTDGDSRVIVTKPDIAGFGLNWQHCNKIGLIGLSHSYEQFYQLIRRCYRFGQKRRVDVHIAISDRDGAVLANIQRKQQEADRLANGIVAAMAEYSREEVGNARRDVTEYQPKERMDLSIWKSAPKKSTSSQAEANPTISPAAR